MFEPWKNAVDPASVPVRRLANGVVMPGIGLGTFGSDKYGPAEIAEAVRGALRTGYRLIDCAACYGNEDLIALPDELSYEDGAQVACGFGTCYEALMKMGVSGNDRVLVTGLGPVGLAALMLAKAMGCEMTIGCDVLPERLELAKELCLADYVINSADTAACEAKIMELTKGYGCERTVDCSANNGARAMAIRCTREWGKMVMVGEGNDVTFNPSPDIMHGQKTIYGSWVTSLWRMEELVEHLVRWGIHPDKLITHRFTLDEADKAYALMASGKCGKVAVVFPDEDDEK